MIPALYRRVFSMRRRGETLAWQLHTIALSRLPKVKRCTWLLTLDQRYDIAFELSLTNE